MKLLRLVLALVACVLALFRAGATSVEDYTFTHLGIEDGVAGPHIFTICQTSDGVVWWSTKNTVDRFNGSAVRNYFLDENAPYSHFAGRTIGLTLSCDGREELYAYDNKGRIFRYSPLQDDFIAVADVLSGSVNPSGKLPVTLAGRYEDVPSARNFGVSEGEINTVRYEEDLMVGYRHFTTAGVKPLYPFGFGLSYTRFAYSDFRLEGNELVVKVSNAGMVPGREVVQFYVEKPALSEGRPVRELCAFGKTAVLEPGASEELRVSLQGVVNPLEQWADGHWTLARGTYKFWAAASSQDLRLSTETMMD